MLTRQQEPNPTTVILASTKDEASMNIARQLLQNHAFESTGITLLGRPLYQMGSLLFAMLETELIEPPDLDAYFNPQAYVFLSRHWAESGIPSLTVHTTGNFTGQTELGGRPREVGMINPDLMKNYLTTLDNVRKDDKELQTYEVTIEATHHGPTSLKRPVLFVELGSSEKNWGDEHAAKLVARAVVESLTIRVKTWDKVAMAFGGTHYPGKLNKLLRESDIALSAVVAKHSLAGIDSDMFAQIIQKTTRFPRFVTVDWKGMGPHREKIIGFAKQFALEVMRL